MNLSTYIALLSFIYSIKLKEGFWRTSVWWWRRFLCARGRALVAVVEEAGVEAMVEETSLSSIDDGGGDWWSREQRSREQRGLRELWDQSERTQDGLLFIGSKISAMVLN
jgi:hypothetical protein